MLVGICQAVEEYVIKWNRISGRLTQYPIGGLLVFYQGLTLAIVAVAALIA